MINLRLVERIDGTWCAYVEGQEQDAVVGPTDDAALGRLVREQPGQFGIGAVVVGENRTFSGGEQWLLDLGIPVTIVDDERCVAMMTDFIGSNPELWNEDIGE